MGINRNTITKGGDATVVVPLSTCSQPVDLQAVENLTCSFYTEEGGQAIERELADFVIDGDNGITLLRWQELDQLPDGVIRYTVEYDYEGEHIKIDQYTNYYLKTAPGYIPMDFVSRDEVDAVVASALTSSAGTEVIENIIEEAGYVDEDFVNSAITQAVSGLVDEEYVQNAINENDWAFIIHSPFIQSEIDEVVRAAKMNPATTEGRAKMVVFYPVGESYFPFYPTNPYRPYDDHDAYFWSVYGYPTHIDLVLLWLDEGEMPSDINVNTHREQYRLDYMLTPDNSKTINGETLKARYAGDNIALATPDDIQGLQDQIDDLPASSAMTEAIQSAITASNLVYAVSSTNKIWAGSREAYSAQTIDNTTLYFITN